MALWVPSATSDTKKLVLTRALRGLSDGAVSVLLAAYLQAIGYTPFEIGVVITGTMLGSAALTLAVGLFAHRARRRVLLLVSSALMVATGVMFFSVTSFVPVVLVAVVGTMNPSAGDVSLFLPIEQAALSETIADRDRTAAFARYNLAGNFAGALGALASGIPAAIAKRENVEIAFASRCAFLFYAAVGVVSALIYASLSPGMEREHATKAAPLAKSRSVVLQLAALFSLDSFGGGFTVQSLLALWLFRRFDLDLATAGAVFFGANLLAACSQLLSPWLARRIGLVRTMVFTHLPANGLLVLAAFMPNAPLAIALLLARMSLSQMDVPARQSYVMAVVPPEERSAAASVTNVPRSLASAAPPLLTGWLLSKTSFGWPLILGGALKAIYDLLLLAAFQARKPPEESVSKDVKASR